MPNVIEDGSPVEEVTVAGRGGKYLTFFLEDEEFGIPILAVKEITGLQAITAVPQAPTYVRGVSNLRGKVIPIVDLRSRFGLESHPDTEETCIIVIHSQNRMVGVVVDRVSEVRRIPEEEIVDPPSLDYGARMEGILGIGKSSERVTLLLEMDALIPTASLTNLAQ